MPATPTEDLEGKHYLTLIARLLLSSSGALMRGELVDAEGTTLVRFVGQDGLLDAVRSYLASWEEQAGPDPTRGGRDPQVGSRQ